MGREEELAEVIVDHSLDVDEGETVFIRFDYPAHTLAEEVYRAVEAYGGTPTYDADAVESVDATAQIQAEERGAYSGEPVTHIGVDSNRSWDTSDDYRYTLMRYPTDLHAERATMDRDELRDTVYDGALRDWDAARSQMEELASRIEDGSTVRIQDDEATDLTMDIGTQRNVNRTGVIDDGRVNLPGGEVFTCPVAASVDGTITFTPSVYRDGTEISDVTLVFEEGELVEYSAASGEEYLDKQFAADDDAARVGEIGIGTNTDIRRFTGVTLLDEKLAGTVHMALGNDFEEAYAVDHTGMGQHGLSEEAFQEATEILQEAYQEGRYDQMIPETDAEAVFLPVYEAFLDVADEEIQRQRPDTDVHMDLIKNMHGGGKLWIDDELVIEDGQFAGLDEFDQVPDPLS